MKPSLGTLGWLVGLAICTESYAQVSQSLEQSGGVTYQVTRQVVPKSIPVTEYQTRQSVTYQPQTTTQFQTYAQTYVSPVTQYQWVSRYKGWWNPFVRPYWSTQLEPVTSWQAHQGTVQVPVTRTDMVPYTHTAQVPVTTYRTVQEEHISRVAVSASPIGAAGSTSVATRPLDSYGGQQMASDPPRSGGDYRR
jgi:hypothetical protein